MSIKFLILGGGGYFGLGGGGRGGSADLIFMGARIFLKKRGSLHMSKDGSIWQLLVLCLLALGDTVPKCYVLL